MTSRFVVRPEAEADIEEAFGWYETRSSGLGIRFLDAVGITLEIVRESPQRFPSMHREPDLTIRRALLEGFPYGVFFIWALRGIVWVKFTSFETAAGAEACRSGSSDGGSLHLESRSTAVG